MKEWNIPIKRPKHSEIRKSFVFSLNFEINTHVHISIQPLRILCRQLQIKPLHLNASFGLDIGLSLLSQFRTPCFTRSRILSIEFFIF
ncbi:hypothetical protein RJT34_07760 [Clitoria ternatea]|uniref:Uncharacterized protein n=1 Tax=Clitoria ternatea TaxID=43366 RepID=A0AAN9K3R4_CLITE